jgi:hypothetical protein
MALRPTRETAQTTPVPAAVPSATQLDCSLHLGAVLEGAYFFGRPGGYPVFLMSVPVGGPRLRAGTDGAWHGRPDRQHRRPRVRSLALPSPSRRGQAPTCWPLHGE